MSRKSVFDAARSAGANFNVPGNIAILNNALDRIGVGEDGGSRSMKDAELFFKGVRGVTGSLDQVQVSVINSLLTDASHWSVSWLAYGLATAWHEARLKPIEEIGKGKGRKYGVPDKTGQVPYGRGLVQLTWDYNYARADKELGLGGALVKDYDLALDSMVAGKILVGGMEEGWFTGKKLADYLPDPRGTDAQFREARRIINGTDRAELIAGYAAQFQAACTAGGWA